MSSTSTSAIYNDVKKDPSLLEPPSYDSAVNAPSPSSQRQRARSQPPEAARDTTRYASPPPDYQPRQSQQQQRSQQPRQPLNASTPTSYDNEDYYYPADDNLAPGYGYPSNYGYGYGDPSAYYGGSRRGMRRSGMGRHGHHGMGMGMGMGMNPGMGPTGPMGMGMRGNRFGGRRMCNCDYDCGYTCSYYQQYPDNRMGMGMGGGMMGGGMGMGRRRRGPIGLAVSLVESGLAHRSQSREQDLRAREVEQREREQQEQERERQGR